MRTIRIGLATYFDIHTGRANFPARCTIASALYPYRGLDEESGKNKAGDPRCREYFHRL